MSKDVISSTQELVQSVFAELGLGDFKIELYVSHASLDVGLVLTKKFGAEYELTATTIVDKMRDIRNNICNSPVVAHNVKDPLEKRIIELEQRIKELSELQTYKNYYDLELQLRHGRK